MAEPIHGVLFDKDGTLFDFDATWSVWAATTLTDMAGGDAVRATALGALIGYDMATRQFDPASPVIAGTPDDIVRMLQPGVPEMGPTEMADHLNASAALAPQVEAVPLTPLISKLHAMGLTLGVATNDAETPARAHLASAGHEASFAYIAGYDSGYGGKPEPGMCLGFIAATGLSSSNVIMVGDSAHDLVAGRAAGMRVVAVLTGLAGEDVLAPLADVVLPDVAHLPDWIAAQNT